VATHVGRDPFPWALAALVLYAVAVVITVAVNVPLNDALKAAAPTADPARVRADFHETRWAVFNVIRVATSSGAFVCLACALRVS
jgi:uncharacterized membrane protein